MWIGGFRYRTDRWSDRIGSSLVWGWVGDTKWNYTNWGKNEPNNSGQGGTIGTVMWQNGQWDDMYQSRNYPAVYKIPNY